MSEISELTSVVGKISSDVTALIRNTIKNNEKESKGRDEANIIKAISEMAKRSQKADTALSTKFKTLKDKVSGSSKEEQKLLNEILAASDNTKIMNELSEIKGEQRNTIGKKLEKINYELQESNRRDVFGVVNEVLKLTTNIQTQGKATTKQIDDYSAKISTSLNDLEGQINGKIYNEFKSGTTTVVEELKAGFSQSENTSTNILDRISEKFNQFKSEFDNFKSEFGKKAETDATSRLKDVVGGSVSVTKKDIETIQKRVVNLNADSIERISSVISDLTVSKKDTETIQKRVVNLNVDSVKRISSSMGDLLTDMITDVKGDMSFFSRNINDRFAQVTESIVNIEDSVIGMTSTNEGIKDDTKVLSKIMPAIEEINKNTEEAIEKDDEEDDAQYRKRLLKEKKAREIEEARNKGNKKNGGGDNEELKELLKEYNKKNETMLGKLSEGFKKIKGLFEPTSLMEWLAKLAFVVTIGVYIWNNRKVFMEKITQIWDKVIWPGLVTLWKAVKWKELFKDVAKFLIEFGAGIVKVVKNISGYIWDWFNGDLKGQKQSGMQTIKDYLIKALKWAWANKEDFFNLLLGGGAALLLATAFFGAIGTAFLGPGMMFMLFGVAKLPFKIIKAITTPILSYLWRKGVGLVSSLVGKLGNALKGVSTGLFSWFTKKSDDVAGAAARLTKGGADAAKPGFFSRAYSATKKYAGNAASAVGGAAKSTAKFAAKYSGAEAVYKWGKGKITKGLNVAAPFLKKSTGKIMGGVKPLMKKFAKPVLSRMGTSGAAASILLSVLAPGIIEGATGGFDTKRKSVLTAAPLVLGGLGGLAGGALLGTVGALGGPLAFIAALGGNIAGGYVGEKIGGMIAPSIADYFGYTKEQEQEEIRAKKEASNSGIMDSIQGGNEQKALEQVQGGLDANLNLDAGEEFGDNAMQPMASSGKVTLKKVAGQNSASDIVNNENLANVHVMSTREIMAQSKRDRKERGDDEIGNADLLKMGAMGINTTNSMAGSLASHITGLASQIEELRGELESMDSKNNSAWE